MKSPSSKEDSKEDSFLTPNKSESSQYKSFNNSHNYIVNGEDRSQNNYSSSSNSNIIEERRPLVALGQMMRPPATINADMTQYDINGGEAMSPLAMMGISEDHNQLLLNTSLKFQIPSFSRNLFLREQPLNTAFLFVKPNANTEETVILIRERILDEINPFDDEDGTAGIIAEYTIEADTIKQDDIIDKQYKGLARYAKGIRGVQSAKSMISPTKFEKIFGEEFDKVVEEKRIYNAVEALSACGCTPELLNTLWVEAERFEPLKKVEQFGKDYCCANLLINDKNVYVINGFYLALVEPYVTHGTSIHAFVIQWDASSLTWKDFREKVIGANDPTEAEEGSLRQLIYEKYEELGITSRPNKTNNAIHASVSPLEALAEQCIWLKHDIKSIDFGRLLLSRGVPEPVILDWCHDFKVKVPDTDNESDDAFVFKSPFELVEDLDANECANKLIGVYDYELFETVEHSRCCKFGSNSKKNY